MNEFKELDVLENADESVKERLAEEFPPQDNEEKERVFRMSERKYNIKKNNNADENFSGEESVNGVEIYKRPKWKIFASIAACMAIIAGIGGAGYMMKHLKGGVPDTVMSEINDSSTAPFGDFAESEYCIPDYNSDRKTFHLNDKFDIDIPYYSGEVIAYEKRHKIAEFFNSQEWKEAAPNEENEGGRKIKMTPEEIAENYISFQSVADGEIRMIEISSENVLTYNYYETKEENGETVCDKYYYQEYEIDWDLFRSAINGILNDTAEETVEENAVPFGDFSELEYYIPENIPEKAENIYLNEDEDNVAFTLMDGKTIEKEKRDKLAEFFNSYDWAKHKGSADYYNELITPSMLISRNDPDKETISFCYRNDKEIRMIEIKKIEDIEYLLYTHFDYITNENGKLIKVNYGETDETSFPYELFIIDFELFKSTIESILSEEEVQAAPEDNNYLNIVNNLEKYDDFRYQDRIEDDPSKADRDYKLIYDDSVIELYMGDVVASEKREKLLDIIRNSDWTSEPVPADILPDYEKNGSENDEHFTECYSLLENTGTDFISLSIYTNCIQMNVYECEYKEEDDTYSIINENYYFMRFSDPNFMTEVYNILYGGNEISSDMT